jgi:hypothetical protein
VTARWVCAGSGAATLVAPLLDAEEMTVPTPRLAGPMTSGAVDKLGRAGTWIVKRSTAKDRFRRALARVGEWCRRHRHDDVCAQQQALAQKLRGHFGYYGIIGNHEALQRFWREVTRAWQKWLNRRSQRARMN